MSDLSEAIARAQERLERMTQDDREKFYHIILREELQRGIAANTLRARASTDSNTTGEDG